MLREEAHNARPKTHNTGAIMTSYWQTNVVWRRVWESHKTNTAKWRSVACHARKWSPAFWRSLSRCHNKGTTDGWPEGRKEAELSDSTQLDWIVWATWGCVRGVCEGSSTVYGPLAALRGKQQCERVLYVFFRNLSKKYQPKKNSREEEESK